MRQKNRVRVTLVVIGLGVCFGCKDIPPSNSGNMDTKADSIINSSSQSSQKPRVEINSLVGNWVRTDAPYQLNLLEFSSDGTIKAEYLNPKPIHIGKASWLDNNNLLNIYVELRDENYPGSSYTLYYFADKDLLAGKYFQAVEGQTYDVGFMRAK